MDEQTATPSEASRTEPTHAPDEVVDRVIAFLRGIEADNAR